jgi:hypothetical protein
MASEPQLSDQDRALLERLAGRVVELRMEVPAVLALETAKPLALLASQAMVFFEPMIQALFRFSDYRRVALLLERRDVIELLARRIEDRAEETRRARRASAGSSGAAPPPAGS